MPSKQKPKARPGPVEHRTTEWDLEGAPTWPQRPRVPSGLQVALLGLISGN